MKGIFRYWIYADNLLPVLENIANNVHYYKCDLTNTSQLSSVATKIRSEVGTPTILVNNAGVARGKSILDATEKDIRFVFDVNTLAHYWTVKEFLPDMIKNNHGHIVTVASIAAYVVAAQMTDYAASKAAAVSFHEGLGQELRHRYQATRVRTTLMTQGFTRTELFTGFKSDSDFTLPVLYPETVAGAIVDQLLSGDGNHIVLPNAFSMFTGLVSLLFSFYYHRFSISTFFSICCMLIGLNGVYSADGQVGCNLIYRRIQKIS